MQRPSPPGEGPIGSRWLVRSAAPVPPRPSVLPPGAGNEEAKKALKAELERANKVEQGYALGSEVAQGHGHAAAIGRHDDGDDASIAVLEEAQATRLLCARHATGPRSLAADPPKAQPPPPKRNLARAGRRHRSADSLAEDLVRLCDDAGISQRALAEAAGVPQPYVSRILGGAAARSLETYARLAAPLGADLTARLYPTRDPSSATATRRGRSSSLGVLHPRWHPFTEVAVRRQGRGWIDAVLHDAAARVLVASELQSELRRLEQVVRWSAEKAASLPSWEGWPHLGEEPAVSRLLVVRRTRATRAVAAEFERQLRVGYPAHPDDALAALAGAAPWPGPSLVWAVVDGVRTRLVACR